MGWDGDRPTRCLDALVHEVDPNVTTTIHRHSWDDPLHGGGSGWTEVDGGALRLEGVGCDHVPAWSWHRHGNDGSKPGRFMSYSSEPTLWTLGMSLIDDAGHIPFADLPAKPKFSSGITGDDPYARRLRRLEVEAKKRRAGRIHTPYDEQEILATPRGTRTKFLNDRAIGNEASGLTQVMIQFAPGRAVGCTAIRARRGCTWSRDTATASWARRPTKASTTAGRRATSSSSTTSSGTSTSTTTRKTSAASCASTCSIRSSRPCAR
jgi:gentisate 1,2-dioxygenase